MWVQAYCVYPSGYIECASIWIHGGVYPSGYTGVCAYTGTWGVYPYGYTGVCSQVGVGSVCPYGTRGVYPGVYTVMVNIHLYNHYFYMSLKELYRNINLTGGI